MESQDQGRESLYVFVLRYCKLKLHLGQIEESKDDYVSQILAYFQTKGKQTDP